MPGPIVMVYGAPIREVIRSGDLDDMKAMARLAGKWIEESNSVGDDTEEARNAYEELLEAIAAESHQIDVGRNDIVAIENDLLVIQNRQLASKLKMIRSGEEEEVPSITIRLR